MRRLTIALLWLLVWTPLAHAEPHVIGVYTNGLAPGVANDGGEGPVYHLDVRGLDIVEMGSVLIAYRRIPSARGDAAFRDDPVWMESGRLKVIGMGEGGWAVARMVSGPPFELPALDDDGLPRDEVCIGDRVVESGSVGAAAESVVGHFDHDLLFEEGTHELREEGYEVLRLWLSRFAVGGAVRVDVGIRDDQVAVVGRGAGTHERLARTAGPEGVGLAEVRGASGDVSLAQRRAARLGRLVVEILGVNPAAVLSTTSWPDEAVSDANTVTIRLLDTVPLAELAPGQGPEGVGAPLAERPSGEDAR